MPLNQLLVEVHMYSYRKWQSKGKKENTRIGVEIKGEATWSTLDIDFHRKKILKSKAEETTSMAIDGQSINYFKQN